MGERLGRYELLGLLATGGMGEVYLARARGLAGFERLVVIKRSVPSRAHDRDAVFAEARLVATLQHTNIVQVYDVETDGPTVFIAMEFLHGQDVRTVLKRAWKGDGRLPIAVAITIAQAMCAGLAFAHDKRDADGLPLEIVHRDVSPSNVFVTYDGGVKVIDFGIAKATSLPSETQLGTIKGKPGYMSPEQCRGELLDRRSDLFCVGIMLYEMTTGRRPFRGDTEYMTCRHICERDPERPTALDPSYPPQLEAIVMSALAKDPRDRVASASVLQEQLARVVAELQLDTSQWALQRYMAELFGDELAAWQAAQRTGRSLVDHVIRTTTASPDAGPTVVEPDRDDAGQAMTSATVRERPVRRARRRAVAVVVSVAMSAAVVVTYLAAGSTGAPSIHAAPAAPPSQAGAPPVAADDPPALIMPTPSLPVVQPAEPMVRADPPARTEPAIHAEAEARKQPGRAIRKPKRKAAAKPASDTATRSTTPVVAPVIPRGPDDPIE